MKRDMGLERLLASMTARVSSMANGEMLFHIECKNGVPGVLGRMAIASELEILINRRIAKAKAAVKGKA